MDIVKHLRAGDSTSEVLDAAANTIEWRRAESEDLRSNLTLAEKALEPFASVAAAYDYFVAEAMPELRFPVAGTMYADRGFERELIESDFHRARAALTAIREGTK